MDQSITFLELMQDQSFKFDLSRPGSFHPMFAFLPLPPPVSQDSTLVADRRGLRTMKKTTRGRQIMELLWSSAVSP